MAAGVHHVPGEMVEDILSRVAVKSLLRFKTCSKKWYSLLSQDHQFSNFHLKRSKDNLRYQANSQVIKRICFTDTQVESLNFETNVSRKFNFPVQIDLHTQCYPIGSANGLVCLGITYRPCCYIWNPCTDECKKISIGVPFSRIEGIGYRLYGFGYDSCSDDYKIVGDWDRHFRVFSLKTNSWKIFQRTFGILKNGFQFNGALHWCVYGKLVSFDLAKDVFSFIKVPDKISEFYHTPFFEYQGLLYLSGIYSKSIWMMKECTHGEPNWVKSNIFLAKELISPLGISTLGELVYLVDGGSGFVKSDIHGNVSDDVKSRIVKPDAFVYTESLISPRCFDHLQPRFKKMIKRPRKQSLQPCTVQKDDRKTKKTKENLCDLIDAFGSSTKPEY